MNYFDGTSIKVGDRVRLGINCYGTVICSIDDNEYDSSYPLSEWGYLEKGILVSSPQLGIIHFSEEDEDLELLSRSSPP